jgi:sec-independent protein translocase protein TatA
VGLDNPIHIAFVLLIVLLVFGAKRLPELGRSLGSGMRGFKESISGEVSPEQIDHLDPAPATPVVMVPVADPAAERTSVRPAA